MVVRRLRLLTLVVACALPLCRAQGTTLFSDDFNTNSSALWTVNKAPTGNANNQQATWAFDYSAFGIPAAPGTSDTLGLRLRSNLPLDGLGNEVTTRPAGAISGLSLSPTGKSFGTSYKATFYAWANFNGNGTASGTAGLSDNGFSEGGTFNVMFALGTAGAAPLVVGNTGLAVNASMDGIGFATTGDGGITNDYRVYPVSGTISAAASGVYAAGSTANTNALYTTLFPQVAAPAIQSTLAAAEFADPRDPQQGLTQAGAFGFAWHKVVLTKNGNSVTWDIDDTRIATVDATALTLAGQNIALGMSDINATTTRHPSLVFTLFDNLVVTDLPAPLTADFNHDNTVNGTDLGIWQTGFGIDATGDANSDGVTNGADYLTWQRQNGLSQGAAVAGAVPEPATLAMIALAASCAAFARLR